MAKYVLVVLALFLVGLGCYGRGYEQAELEYKAELAEQQRKAVEVFNQQQSNLLEVESQLLDADDKVKTVYKDRVKRITQTVTKYVESNNLSDCRLDDFGLQQVNASLSGSGEAYGVKLSVDFMPKVRAIERR